MSTPPSEYCPSAAPSTSSAATPASWPPRTIYGTAWRAAVVIVVAVMCGTVGTWGASQLVKLDSQLGATPALVATIPVVLLLSHWLRTRQGFLVAPLLGMFLGALGGAHLLHDGHLSLRPPYLTHGSAARLEVTMLAAGAAVALVGIAWGAVGGHRNPRPNDSRKLQVEVKE